MKNPAVLTGATNVLGLSFFVVWTISLCVILGVVGSYPVIRRQLAIVSVGLVLMTADLVWRYRQSPDTTMWRFISDVAGGAVAYIPAWAWMPAISTIAAIYWVGE